MLRTWLFRRSRGMILAALALVLGAGTAVAQGRIEGTVRDINTADPVPNARIVIVGTDLAATTNQNGYYAIESVPVGTYEVRVSVIGFQQVTITNQRVASGLPTVVNFSLAQSILRLEGVVVTGVAEAQQAVKLPFTVDQVKAEDLPVPTMSAEESIRGKVAGARIVKGSGQPGSGVAVTLRGATSINTSGRSNEPLYVVDGVILGASMVDVDALDVESIEVVKGAAAAALYGSRAANGVIQVRTRRGRDLPEGETRITFRSEFGQNQLAKKLNVNQHHWFQTTSDSLNWLNAAGAATTDRTARVIGWDSLPVAQGGQPGNRWAFAENRYPREIAGEGLVDHWDEFFNPNMFTTNTLNIAHRTGSTNFLASVADTREEGVIRRTNGYERRNARLNVDHRIGRDLDFSASGYYSRSMSDAVGGGSDNPFYAIMFVAPDVRLDTIYPEDQRRDTLDFVIQPDPANQEDNPLYTPANNDIADERGRVMGNFRLRWRPGQLFDLEGEFSYDRSDRNYTQYNFKGWRSADGQGPVTGRYYKSNGTDQAINGSITATFTRSFGDLNTVTRFRALAERQQGNSFSAEANDLIVNDVKDLDVGNSTLENVSSSSDEVKSLGYFGSLQLDYKDRYILDGLLRRDGSSLFGQDNRWRTYYRIGGAWRMAQEPWWPIDAIDEFKLRAAQGTAGGRPGFSAQYETFSVSGGNLSKSQLGNRLLVPEYARETEFGVDMILFGRLSLGITRALSTVQDQILSVPLPGVFGYSNQWQNAGTLETKTWEGTLQWQVAQTPSFGWNMNFVIDNTEQRITEFDRTPYKTGPGSAFYIREGEELGTLYGTRWAKVCGDLEPLGLDAAACNSQFKVNDDGYLVPVGSGNDWTEGVSKGLWGTQPVIVNSAGDTIVQRTAGGFRWGLPARSWGIETKTLADGTVIVDTTDYVPMGSSLPDLNIGFGNNFRVGGFTLYFLFDAMIGGDIYNQTRQWPARELMAEEVDQSAKATEFKKPIDYYNSLYYVNAVNSHYVEDGTYLKLRELSLRYTFGRGALEGILGGFVKRVSLAFIGRNLLTFTNYTGYDPEVSSAGGNSTFQRFDDFIYPNFRTISGSVEIEF